MPEGFVIMQIGDDDLDRVRDEVIFPALQAAGLEPRRVDRHNWLSVHRRRRGRARSGVVARGSQRADVRHDGRARADPGPGGHGDGGSGDWRIYRVDRRAVCGRGDGTRPPVSAIAPTTCLGAAGRQRWVAAGLTSARIVTVLTENDWTARSRVMAGSIGSRAKSRERGTKAAFSPQWVGLRCEGF